MFITNYNRTKIKSVSGEQWLTIPLKKSDTKVINKLNYLETNWRDKVIKTIQMNYAKAPFFKEIFPLLEEIIFYPTNNIATYNINGITKVCTHLGIHNKQFILASEMNLIGQERNDRIIEICQKANSNQYFSGNGGKKYHDENYFIAKGINITYTNFTQKPYSQLYGEFIPGLSIIDALFNHNIKML